MYFSEIAVDPEFRGRGIGKMLAKKRIGVAKKSECSAIYVSCWEGGYISKLYEKLGFLPIIKAGPRYKDGNAEKVMCKLLD